MSTEQQRDELRRLLLEQRRRLEDELDEDVIAAMTPKQKERALQGVADPQSEERIAVLIESLGMGEEEVDPVLVLSKKEQAELAEFDEYDELDVELDDDQRARRDELVEKARLIAEAEARRKAEREKRAARKAELDKEKTDEELKVIIGGGFAPTNMQVVGPGHPLEETHLGREVDEGLVDRPPQVYATLKKEVKKSKATERGLWLLGFDLEAPDLPTKVPGTGAKIEDEDGNKVNARQRLIDEIASRDGVTLINKNSMLPDGERASEKGIDTNGFLVTVKDEDLEDGPDGKRGLWIPESDNEGGFVLAFKERNWHAIGIQKDLDPWLKQRNVTAVQMLSYDSGVDPTDIPNKDRSGGRAARAGGVRQGPDIVTAADMKKYISELEEPLREREKGEARSGSDLDRILSRELLEERKRAGEPTSAEIRAADADARAVRRELVTTNEAGDVVDNRTIKNMIDAIDELLNATSMTRKQQSELRATMTDLIAKWFAINKPKATSVSDWWDSLSGEEKAKMMGIVRDEDGHEIGYVDGGLRNMQAVVREATLGLPARTPQKRRERRVTVLAPRSAEREPGSPDDYIPINQAEHIPPPAWGSPLVAEFMGLK
jgi:hypothetical protein